MHVGQTIADLVNFREEGRAGGMNTENRPFLLVPCIIQLFSLNFRILSIFFADRVSWFARARRFLDLSLFLCSYTRN